MSTETEKKRTKIYKRKNSSTIESKPLTILVNNATHITKEMIDVVAASVEVGQFLDTACLINNISPDSFYSLMNSKKNAYAQYATEAIKKAEALCEKNLIERFLDKDSNSSKAVQEFLLLTNPKFSKRYRVQIQYEIGILLKIMKQTLPSSDYLRILEVLKNTDRSEIVAELDSLLLV